MRIRIATMEDCAAIARVHVDTWRSTYRGIVPESYLSAMSYEQHERQWRETISEHSPDFVYVAEEPAQHIVGFSSGGPALVRDEPLYRGELFTLYVLQAYQHEGIGRQLFLAVARHLVSIGLPSMLLWVLAQNSARHFYEKMGGKFVKFGTFTITNAEIEEVAYGWPDISDLGREVDG
jgi:ribosomal protein S18 acetylase RimI-like enzyme